MEYLQLMYFIDMHLLVPLVTAEIVKDKASLTIIFGQSISIKSTE